MTPVGGAGASTSHVLSGAAFLTSGGAPSLAPMVSRAAALVDDAARTLVAAQQVEWVSDAGERYRAALAAAQQALVRTSALVASAHDVLAQQDRALAQACVDARTALVLGGSGGSG